MELQLPQDFRNEPATRENGATAAPMDSNKSKVELNFILPLSSIKHLYFNVWYFFIERLLGYRLSRLVFFLLEVYRVKIEVLLLGEKGLNCCSADSSYSLEFGTRPTEEESFLKHYQSLLHFSTE